MKYDEKTRRKFFLMEIADELRIIRLGMWNASDEQDFDTAQEQGSKLLARLCRLLAGEQYKEAVEGILDLYRLVILTDI